MDPKPLTIIEVRIPNNRVQSHLGMIRYSKGKLLRPPNKSSAIGFIEYMVGWENYDDYVLYRDAYDAATRKNIIVPIEPRMWEVLTLYGKRCVQQIARRISRWWKRRNYIRLYGKRRTY